MNRLIFVQNIIESEQAERFTEELDTITDMSDVYHTSNTLMRQGKLTPCVIVQTTGNVEEDKPVKVNGAAYFFTCKTKR